MGNWNGVMAMDDELLGAEISAHASYFKAGSRLRAEIRAQIAVLAASETSAVPRWHPSAADLGAGRRQAAAWLAARWRTAGAGIALGFCLAVALPPGMAFFWRGQAPGLPQVLDAQLVAGHVQSLRFGPLIQVASGDRHSVKPWFQGKVDYAPTVLDLAADGFPLRGGRIEQIAGDTVAVLVYGHRQHIVNVYVWPASGTQLPERAERRGFNVLHWSDGSMQFWIISDMDVSEIDRFAQAWRARSAAAPG
jgi:anti-sigma factor RsiW